MSSYSRPTPTWIVLLVSAAMAGFMAAGASTPRERWFWVLLAATCVVLVVRALMSFFRTGG